MRIAYFTEVYWPTLSGVAVTLERTAAELGRRGHGVRVYAPAPTSPLPDGDRAEVHRSPSLPFVLDPAIAWAYPRMGPLIDDLRAFAPDLIHVATEFPMGRAGIRAARVLGLPVVASAHTDYERYAPWYRVGWLMPAGWTYLRNFYRNAEVVLAPTRGFETHLRQRGILHTGRWDRGVDTQGFAPDQRSRAFRESLGLSESDLLVLCVTRLAPEKGIPPLLEAWERVAPSHPSARLAIVGDGILRTELLARMPERASLLGPLEGETLACAYASADVFAFASASETFGNVVLEAMASGLACALVGSGGILEIAEHGRNALLSAVGDPAALAGHIERLLADPELRTRLGRAARETALERQWPAVHDRLLLTYIAYLHRAARVA